MHNLEINQEIHKALGWQSVNRPGALSGWDNYQWQKGDDTSTWGMGPPMPDYANSLDAMHKGESTLTREQRFSYGSLLIEASKEGSEWGMMHADALTRAKAFLKIQRKWRDA